MNPARARLVAISILAGLILVVPVGRAIRSLMRTSSGMSTFARLIGAANAQDVEAVRSLCASHYLASHPLQPSREGGVVGFPRNIHKNFQAWTEGDEVRICPSNRVGPVYRLVKEGDLWKFDGLVGLLKPGGLVETEAVDEDFR